MFFNVLPSAGYDALGDALGAGNRLGRGGAGHDPGHQKNKSQKKGQTVAQFQGNLLSLPRFAMILNIGQHI